MTLRGSIAGKPLSPREQQIHALRTGGMRPCQIERHLNLARTTVDEYLRRIREKQGLVPVRTPRLKFEKYERAYLRWKISYLRALRRRAGYNMARAARLAGLNRTSLYATCGQLGIGFFKAPARRRAL